MKHYKEYKYVLINENVYETVNEIKKLIEFNQMLYLNKIKLRKKLKRIINS